MPLASARSDNGGPIAQRDRRGQRWRPEPGPWRSVAVDVQIAGAP